MSHRSWSCVSSLLLAAMLALAMSLACGARTPLSTEESDAQVASDVGRPDVIRNCFLDCYVGHSCCAGGCSGPAAPMPNDCCACLPGEVNSMSCGNGDHCGR